MHVHAPPTRPHGGSGGSPSRTRSTRSSRSSAFRISFVGKLLRLGYPLLDARTSCKLPQYLPHVLGRSSGQQAIRLDARPIEAILSSDADPTDGGQMVRRTLIRRVRCRIIHCPFLSTRIARRAPEPPAEHPCQKSHLISSLPASFSARLWQKVAREPPEEPTSQIHDARHPNSGAITTWQRHLSSRPSEEAPYPRSRRRPLW